MNFPVLDIKGSNAGEVELNDSVFAVQPSEHAIYLSVKQYLAAQRQGTHKSKERAEIAGSTRKIKKQKGTGTARAGSLKNPLFVGGGRVFGPRPRNYAFKLNKKVKAVARKSALSTKVASKELVVVEDFTLSAPKTKDYINILDALKASGKKSLLVVNTPSKNVYLSSKNVPKAKVVTLDELNTYDIVNTDLLVLSKGAVERLNSIA